MEQENNNDLNVLTSIISLIKTLSKDDQQRILQAVATFLNISLQGPLTTPTSSGLPSPTDVSISLGASPFSEDRSISPKDFIRDKVPQSDVERIACLAYYLTHYRNIPHFKTLDISTLNTEAAQPKLSNASVAVDNATKAGLLVQAIKGSKQISAAGELYVQYLPDRAAARASIKGMRKKKSRSLPIKKPKAQRNEREQSS